MKFIIKENQLNKVSLKKKGELLSKLTDTFYPSLEQKETNGEDIDFFGPNDELIFYFRPKSGEFFIGLNFINKLYSVTGLPFLEYESVKTNRRDEFDNIVREFVKYHFGFSNVEDIYFHWY